MTNTHAVTRISVGKKVYLQTAKYQSVIFICSGEEIKMKKESIFKGAATALITPFTEDGVDYESFGRLIDWQIEQGINALVISGTTGESATMTQLEHKQVLSFAIDRIAGRVPVIAGTGANETSFAVELAKHACSAGADACLVVTPYYNKATQNGLVTMYNVIADASTKPIIVYEIPSRTGVTIQPETLVKIAQHPNIAAVKEASGNIAKIVDEFALLDGALDIYSGNDDQVIPLLSMGGAGVISVLSNLMPKATAQMCDKFFAGDVSGAAKMQCEFMPLIHALFSEVNPIPVKSAMAKMGFCENILRLPLTPMEEAHEAKMFEIMKQFGLTD